MIRKLSIFILLGILHLLLNLNLGYAEEDKIKIWKSQVELTYLSNSGNVEAESLRARMEAVRSLENTKFMVKLGGQYGKSEGREVAKSLFANAKYEYKITPRAYVFGIAGAERDTFAGYDARYEVGAGPGYIFLKSKVDELEGDLGVLYTHEEFTKGGTEDYLSARTWGQYTHSFSETASFVQELEYMVRFDDTEDYRIGSESALIFKITEVLALKTSYTVKFDNQPPIGYKKTDRIFATALLITF